MCNLFVYASLKVVSHYDFSALPMSVTGFQKNVDGRVGGWSELCSFCVEFI